MQDRFEGDLSWIDPNFIIIKNENSNIDGFFIALGSIFNDMQGLILFEKLLSDKYEKPNPAEVTAHAGYYSGVMVQIQKLMVCTIHEFFIFLKNNPSVYESAEFKIILERLSKSNQKLWDFILAAAEDRAPSTTELLKSILKIRNNIGFHYSGKTLRSGYLSRFFGNTKDEKNKLAYYSVGPDFRSTRFYFSDAATEEALYNMGGKKIGESSIGNISLEKYKGQVIEAIELITNIISILLKNYIQSRRVS